MKQKSESLKITENEISIGDDLRNKVIWGILHPVTLGLIYLIIAFIFWGEDSEAALIVMYIAIILFKMIVEKHTDFRKIKYQDGKITVAPSIIWRDAYLCEKINNIRSEQHVLVRHHTDFMHETDINPRNKVLMDYGYKADKIELLHNLSEEDAQKVTEWLEQKITQSHET